MQVLCQQKKRKQSYHQISYLNGSIRAYTRFASSVARCCEARPDRLSGGHWYGKNYRGLGDVFRLRAARRGKRSMFVAGEGGGQDVAKTRVSPRMGARRSSFRAAPGSKGGAFTPGGGAPRPNRIWRSDFPGKNYQESVIDTEPYGKCVTTV